MHTQAHTHTHMRTHREAVLTRGVIEGIGAAHRGRLLLAPGRHVGDEGPAAAPHLCE